MIVTQEGEHMQYSETVKDTTKQPLYVLRPMFAVAM